ncbi:MAG: STAS domain-containing protein [Bryobacteraceae bacterium]
MAENPIARPVAGDANALLQDALQRIETVKDLVVDFTGVNRLDAAELLALEQLAAKTHDHSASVTLRGVHVDVYKVLKLAKVAAPFSFVS